MYTTVRGIPGDAGDSDDPGRSGGSAGAGVSAGAAVSRAPTRTRRVPRLVVTLGLVSCFTDLSSEMVVAVLPVYLTLVLGLTPLQYGVIDGLYQGVTAAVRILGGLVADLTHRPKIVAALGYSLSCVCKLFFLPAHSFAAITTLVAVDRSGKGLRTAPRDAMIAAAADPAALGYSFGVHRAMDTAGALGGPLLAFGVLALLVNGYHLLFVLSFSLAAVGVAVLVLFVPGRPRPQTHAADQAAGAIEPAGPTRIGRTLREFVALTRDGGYRRLLGVGGLLSLTTINDGFIYLTLKDRAGLAATWFPLLYVGTAAVYLVLAIPLGRLADRTGRVRVFLGGHGLAAIGYLGLLVLPSGPGLIAAVLALIGGYYAATDGVLPALTAPMVSKGVRSTGIAGVQTMMAIGGMLSAAVFGGLWAGFGQRTAVGCFLAGLTLAIGASLLLLRGPRPASAAVATG